jgi:hypothetical protein
MVHTLQFDYGEVDLSCKRIPLSIFMRRYWSPSFGELKERTLKAIKEVESRIQF